MYDVIIVGAGPAGISAGLYAKRAGDSTLILYNGESNLEKATLIDNYYGFENGVSGKHLYESGISQAKNIGIDVKNEEVINIENNWQGFNVKTISNLYETKTAIIATGNKKLRPNIEGIREFEGKGVSYCAICDGFFYRNKDVVVIGNGSFAVNEAEDLRKLAKSVTILTNGEEMENTTDFEVVTKRIKRISGESKVCNIDFDDGSNIATEGVFIAIGEAGGGNFAKKMGIITDAMDNFVVDENMQTNIKGLFACGNVNGGLLQVCKAVYEGAKAGLSASNYIKNI